MNSIFLFSSVLIFLLIVIKFSVLPKKNKKIHVILIGAAGSGKGTQAKLIQNTFGLMQLSAGDTLREHRANPNGRYSKEINEFIDKGKLVPSRITNDIIADKIKKNIYHSKKYNGVLFDGYPREISQLEFLDQFLSRYKEEINLAVYIDVPFETLYERLSGRFTCKKCGAIYHKISNPTKVEGECDKCHHSEFSIRADDIDKKAIESRFNIFLKDTQEVIDQYSKRGVVFKVDGDRDPNLIAEDIAKKISSIMNE